MLALDVNVLISAFWTRAHDHDQLRWWVQAQVDADEPVGVSDAVLGAVVRILTNPRMTTTPMSLADALTETSRLRDHPGVVTLAPGPRHWDVFQRLCRSVNAQGNLVADAQHAALAVEHGATWITKDRDFARFSGLRWRHPLHT